MKAVIRHVDLPVRSRDGAETVGLGTVNDRGESVSVEMGTQNDDERIVSIETLRDTHGYETIRIWLAKQ